MKRVLMIGLLLAGVGLFAMAAMAQEEASRLEISERRGKYTVEVENARLGEIMGRMEELSGIKVRLSNDVADKRITLKLRKARYEDVIEELTDSHVLMYEKVGDEYKLTSASLADSFEKMVGGQKLSRGERRDQERMAEEIKQVVEQIDGLHGFAGKLDYDAARELIKQRNEKAGEYVEQLAALGPGGGRAVVAAFPATKSVRARIAMIQALGNMQDPNASSALGALFARGDSFSLREEAVTTLSRRGDPAAKDILVRILGEEQDKRLQAKAVMGLSAHPSALPVLGELVASESANTDLRCEAIRSLGEIGGPAAEQVLARAATSAANPTVKKVASRELDRSFGAGRPERAGE